MGRPASERGNQPHANDHQRSADQTGRPDLAHRHTEQPELVEGERGQDLADDEQPDHGRGAEPRHEKDRADDVEDAEEAADLIRSSAADDRAVQEIIDASDEEFAEPVERASTGSASDRDGRQS